MSALHSNSYRSPRFIVFFGKMSAFVGHSAKITRQSCHITLQRTLIKRNSYHRLAITSKLSQHSNFSALTVGAAATLSTSAAPARAADDASSSIDSAVNIAVDIIKATGDAIKSGVGAVESGIHIAKEAYTQVEPAVKLAADAAAPVVKSAAPVVNSGVTATTAAVKSAGPALEKALSDAGVNTQAIAGFEKAAIDTGKEAVSVSKPFFDQLVTFVTTSEPVVVAEAGLALVAAYYLAGPLLKGLGGALRGYAGDVSPAAALDVLSTQGNCVMVDIRTTREKESAGLPDLPNNGKLVELEYASVADRRVRGQLRNASDIELKVTAMQVAALKKIGKGTTIFLMDRNGGNAKAVARELSNKGFKKSFVVSGGFSGWQGAKLKVKPSTTVSRVEVLLPGAFGTGSSSRTVTSQQRQIGAPRRQLQLPGGQ